MSSKQLTSDELKAFIHDLYQVCVKHQICLGRGEDALTCWKHVPNKELVVRPALNEFVDSSIDLSIQYDSPDLMFLDEWEEDEN